MRKKIIGPDSDDLRSFEELPIGSTITGIGADPVRTGRWRYYRPQLGERTPPCQGGCPAGVDIRGFVSLIRRKSFLEAYRCYTMENPFPGLCGRLCDHPCETSCLRKEFDGSVDIQDLEIFVSLKGSRERIEQDPPHPQRTVAVAGNGIKELASVYFLRRLGYAVVLLTEQGEISETTERILAALDLPVAERLKSEVETVLALGSGYQSAVRIEKRMDPESLAKYDAVLWGKDSKAPKEIPGLFQLEEQGSISLAIGRGKEVAIAIDLYLKKRNMETVREVISLGPLGPLSFSRYLSLGAGENVGKADLVHFEQINTRTFDREGRLRGERGEKQPWREPFTQQEAIRAARRCFQCGWCTLCGRCILYCPDQAAEQDHGRRTVQFDYDFCKGCGICVYECPRGAIDFVKEETGWH